MIKTCGKCGKANDVMRKYCAGCGSSLLRKEEDAIPEPVEELEEEPIAGAPSFSEEARHVLPSEVATKQVELESDEPEAIAVIEEPPLSEEVRIEPEEEVEGHSSEPMSHEEGKQVVADILEKVRVAESRTIDEEDTEPSDTDLEPPSVESLETDEPIVYEEPTVEAEVEEPSDVKLEPLPQEEIPLEEPETVPVDPSPVSMAVDESARDEKIRSIESDIKTFNIEREQFQSELDKIRTRLDEEVERCLVVSETKRTQAESIERELNLAKKEYNEASKEYKSAEDRRKKELSNAEKRIRNTDKRLKKAEESKNKRIQELEKERRKREEEAEKN